MLDRPGGALPNDRYLAQYEGSRQLVDPVNYQPYGYAEAERESLFDPLKLLFLLIQYRWLIAFLLACAVVVGTIVTFMMTPVYQSQVRLEIMTPSARVFQDLEVVSESSDVRAFQTAREKIMSRALAQRVVYELGLADKPDFLYPAPNFSPVNILNRAFGLNLGQELTDPSPEARENLAIRRVLDNMSVNLVPNTSLLAISFRDQKPEYARDVSNQIAKSYIDQRVDQTGQTSELARQFIQEQVIQVKERLQESEKALVDYARQSGISVSGDEKSLIASNIESLNAALSKAIEERLDSDVLVSQIEAGRGDSIEQVIGSEPLQKIRASIVELQAEYQQKLSTFKPGFPEMQQLQMRIRELERQYKAGVEAILMGVRMKREEQVKREEELRSKLAELEKEQIAYEDKNIQYTILKREVDSNRSQYDSLIAKLNELGVGSELKSENASIVDPAVLAERPVSPRLSINLAIALVAFAGLGAAIIYLLELMNNTFVNPDQVERELGIPVLGILPKIEEEDLAESLTDPKSGLSEAYRSLRTSIQFSGTEGLPKTLMVSSSEPNEAKSTTVRKLATDFGALGTKVLVVDADMRKPTMHRQFGVDNTLGLSNLLTNSVGRDDLPGTIKKTKEDNVWVITSGTLPPNPADLLSSTKMALLVQYMSARFDLIIIDSPPVIGLSDAPILSRIAHSTLLLVSANNVSRKSAKAALKRLRSAGANVIGAALSRFAVGKFDYNYAYKYMNYYYYQYGGELPKLEAKGGGLKADAQKTGTFVDRMARSIRNAAARLGDRLKPVN